MFDTKSAFSLGTYLRDNPIEEGHNFLFEDFFRSKFTFTFSRLEF